MEAKQLSDYKVARLKTEAFEWMSACETRVQELERKKLKDLKAVRDFLDRQCRETAGRHNESGGKQERSTEAETMEWAPSPTASTHDGADAHLLQYPKNAVSVFPRIHHLFGCQSKSIFGQTANVIKEGNPVTNNASPATAILVLHLGKKYREIDLANPCSARIVIQSLKSSFLGREPRHPKDFPGVRDAHH